MNTNLCVFTGHLTKDPELRYSQENKPFATFSIAVNGYGEKTDFINVKTFGKKAEVCHKYLEKGSMVCVVGSIHVDNVNKDGQWKTYVNLFANDVEFINTTKKEQKEEEIPQGNFNKVEEDLPF